MPSTPALPLLRLTRAEAAVGAAHAELVEEPRRTQVERGEALAAGLLRKGASKPRFARTGRSSNTLLTNKP